MIIFIQVKLEAMIQFKGFSDAFVNKYLTFKHITVSRIEYICITYILCLYYYLCIFYM